jgi:diguanylate cyclase (GGDEF)-like protein
MTALFGKIKEVLIKRKSLILQWILPTLSFLLIVAILIGSAVSDMKKSIGTLVQKQFEDAATYYASSFYDTMHTLKESTIPVTAMLQTDKIKDVTDLKQAVPYLFSLKISSNVLDVWMVENDGSGIDANGSEFTLEQEELMEAVRGGQKQFVLTPYGAEEQYAIAYVCPFNSNRTALVAFYDPSAFLIDTSVYHLDSHTWYAIIDGKGNVITLNAGNSKGMTKENNVLDDLKEGYIYDYKYSQIVSKMIKKSEFDFTARVGDSEQYYVMAPSKVNNWYFVLSTPNSYVEKLISRSLAGINRMILCVIIAVIVFFVVIIGMAIFNRKKVADENKELEVKADTDLLTGLNNKIATERKIKEYIARNPEGQAMLFVLDIDNFKKINDTMGHAFGDEVLRNIGMRLKAAFRSTDIVGRIGGDEFVLFLKDINTEELIQKEADKLLSVFENFQVGSYTKYTVTASIGCAIFPRDAQDWESMYRAADIGVYKAKRGGKNQLAFYDNHEDIEIGQDV